MILEFLIHKFRSFFFFFFYCESINLYSDFNSLPSQLLKRNMDMEEWKRLYSEKEIMKRLPFSTRMLRTGKTAGKSALIVWERVKQLSQFKHGFSPSSQNHCVAQTSSVASNHFVPLTSDHHLGTWLYIF